MIDNVVEIIEIITNIILLDIIMPILDGWEFIFETFCVQ
jgi:CheY-like chemotaxis protein